MKSSDTSLAIDPAHSTAIVNAMSATPSASDKKPLRVRIIKNWPGTALLNHSPGGSGTWDSVRFLIDDEDGNESDYVIVLNWAARPTRVRCDPRNVWLAVMEPPNEQFRPWHQGARFFGRVFHGDQTVSGPRYTLDTCPVFWFFDKSFDDLVKISPGDKPKTLSWITSNRTDTPGHRLRMAFLARLRSALPLDLYGRGFVPIDDKWDALYPYKYSIAVENFRSPYYWSEKIVDCLLAWTMPIYCGCTRIEQFLPRESFLRFDMDDPGAIDFIRQAIEGGLYERSVDAIAEARQLILKKHQLFPWIADRVRAWDQTLCGRRPRDIDICNPMPSGETLWGRVRFSAIRRIPRLVRYLGETP
jgi:hypothetical protein